MRYSFGTIFLVTSFLIMISCSDNFIDYPENHELEDIDLVDKGIQNSEMVKNLTESFMTNVTKSALDLVYPDYYGGTYVNKDKDFVILVKGNPQEYRENLINRTKSEHFVIQSCEYSYKDLFEQMQNLNEFVLKEENQHIVQNLQIRGFYIANSDNRLVVKLGECTDEKIMQFRNQIMDSPLFSFNEQVEISKFYIDLQPGYPVNDGAYQGGVGYRARSSNGKAGIVTAGHLLNRVGKPLYLNAGGTSNKLGNASHSIVGGTIDAAFCPIDNTSLYKLSNKTKFSNITLIPQIGYVTQGLMLMMDGSVSNVSDGEVINGFASESIWDPATNKYIYLTGIIQVAMFAQPGDSGSIVFDDKSRKIVGILSAGNNSYSVVTPAASINPSFNLTMY